jgi:predicted dehydrogenase
LAEILRMGNSRSPGAAVVGTGFIGRVHVEALRRIGARVAGVLGSSAERTQAACRQFGLESAFESFDQILADPRVDVVHIATPNRWHFGQASRALRAGKHVLCEKPLAMTPQETAELVKLAQTSGLAAGVCYNVRFYPLCLEARQRVRAGALGTLWHVAGSYTQDWLLHETDFNWRVLRAEGGSLRAVADIGTHWLDLAQFITGLRVSAVCARLKTAHPTRMRPAGPAETFSGAASAPGREPVSILTEDCGAVLLEFESGQTGCLWVSQVTAGRKNRLFIEVAGRNAALAFDAQRPEELWVGRRDQPNELLERDPSIMSAAARAAADYPGGHAEGFPDTFKQLFRAFYAWVARGGQAPDAVPTFADGHHEARLCSAIERSHHERRWVSLDEVEP